MTFTCWGLITFLSGATAGTAAWSYRQRSRIKELEAENQMFRDDILIHTTPSQN